MANTSPRRVPRPRSKGLNQPNLSRFHDHVVIVTGGARGIGQACAARFASEGAFVYIFDMMEAKETLNLVNNKSKNRNKAKSFSLDISSPDQVSKCVKLVIKEHGYIDAVVQCAGITGVTGKQAHLIEASDFEKVWRVNMFGIFNVCKAVLPFMLEENYGRIINVASISGKEGNPGQISYASSKGAVIAATKTLGKDYAKTGITINSIAPAVIQTKMVEKMPLQQQNMMKSKIPMGRTGELEEISGVIAFMASEENSFTTGFCFDLTGGRATY